MENNVLTFAATWPSKCVVTSTRPRLLKPIDPVRVGKNRVILKIQFTKAYRNVTGLGL